jgi:hypothetical protein
MGGMVALILISLHQSSKDICELTELYVSAQYDLDSLTKMNIISLWTIYIVWIMV